jgi:selenocysteine lyase/cysteine desulfurase
MNITRRTLLHGAGTMALASLGRRPWLAATAAPAAALANARSGDVDFPIPAGTTYLNNASWHPMSVQAMAAIQDYLERRVHRITEWPSGGQEVKDDVKARFAALINAKPSEISFIQSTMMGENLVVSGLGLPASGGNVVTDALHFDGSMYLYGSLKARGLDVRTVKPRDWRIDIRDMEKAVDKNTKLVAVSLVSYYNGFQHDLKAVCDLAHAHGAHVYADIIQAAGAVPIDVRASGVDFCACSSFKWLMGDFGLGFLYVREDLLDRVIKRTQYGYEQTADVIAHLLPADPPSSEPYTWAVQKDAGAHFQVGTMSYSALAALHQSLRHIQEVGVANIQAHRQPLIDRLQREMPRLGFESITPAGSTSPIVSFAMKDPVRVAEKLRKANVTVGDSLNRLRVSPSVFNDQRDIDRLLEALA